MRNRRFALFPALVLAVSACGGPGDNVEILDQRTAAWVPQHSNQGLTSAQRFGREDLEAPKPPEMQSAPIGNALLFDLPEGWTEDQGTRMRLINLHPAGDSNADCFVSVLGGDGGGLAENLNRWRKQVGLKNASGAEIAELPIVNLLGGDASLLQVEGSFVGMGTDAQDDWALTGVIVSTPQATIFVKMTGPAALLQAEHENFLAFVTSIHFGEDIVGTPGPAQEPMQTEPEAKPDSETEAEAELVAETESVEDAGGEFLTANGFRFQVPEGWSDAGPRMMCALNFRVGKDTECFLVVLGGDGGGLVPNLDRWQGQLGLDPLSAEEVEALPTADFLGGSAVMHEAVGEYTGMDDQASFDEKTLLGLALLNGESAYFLKMVGPKTEVAEHKGAFLTFAANLEEVK